MPGGQRSSPQQSIFAVPAFAKAPYQKLSIVSLNEGDYAAALTSAASLGITGGAIYDALLAWCATKAEATTIYSWNTRHDARLGPHVAARLTTP